MNSYWNNLRPFEKRVVVGVGALFFAVLNLLFVFPHFSDLTAAHGRMAEAQSKLGKYEAEIAQTNVYMAGLREMEKENSDVPAEEQSLQFANAVNAQAAQSGVRLTSNSAIKTQTNQFFLEKTQTITVQAGEQQLVDFLYSLGSGNSQIRVRGLNLRPDPPRQQLVASVTLVASYQKRSTARSAASTTPQTPGARTPAATAKSPSPFKPESPSGTTATSTTKRP